MLRIAITGGIACGKSLVGTYMAEAGVRVCDADRLAHELIARGTLGFNEIVACFGQAVVGPDGEIDRGRLGGIVFSERHDLAKLNDIVHPKVRRAWTEWLANSPPGSRVSAVIIPLLYEVGESSGWDAVVCVASPDALQVRRLEERGLSEADARKRIAAQLPVGVKMERADYVIVNSGTKQSVREQAQRVLGRIVENASWVQETTT